MAGLGPVFRPIARVILKYTAKPGWTGVPRLVSYPVSFAHITAAMNLALNSPIFPTNKLWYLRLLLYLWHIILF
jgi:hypothetical protein